MKGEVQHRCACAVPHGRTCPRLRRERGHGSWTYRLDLGPGLDARGTWRQRRQIRRSGFRTKTEAEAALARALVELEDGSRTDDRRTSVSGYLDEWLAARKVDLRPTTWRSYEGHVRLYLRPYLGHLRLGELRTAHVESAYATIRQLKASRPLKPVTLRRVHATLLSALNEAVRRRLIAHNPAVHARLERTERPKPRVWDADTVGAFLSAVHADRLYALFHLAVLRGLRRGELCGLRWVDVDLDAGVLHVRQQIVQLGYAVALGSPKTRSGTRSVALDVGTMGALRDHRRRQRDEQGVAASAWVDSGLVFTREDGTALHPEYVTRHFARLVRRADLPMIRLHDLRHTAATLALAAGVEMVVVSRQLGHSSLSITADTYTHVLPVVAADAAERVAALVPTGPRALPGDGAVPRSCPPRQAGAYESSDVGASPQLSSGGPPGDRTLNPRIKSPLLCQLS
jgi:integrase